MFPNTFEAWGFILGSCFISFMIGQWLRRRRKKVKTHDDYVEGLKRRVLAETLAQKKKAKVKKTGRLKK
jgi:hypothetical protein